MAEPTSLTPIAAASFWMKLVGTYWLIGGILSCITIVGAIYGWAFIWLGMKLNSAASLYKQGLESRSVQMLTTANSDLATAVTIAGVFIIIGLVIFALYILGFFLILLLFAGTASTLAN
jgi:hypothetical protein